MILENASDCCACGACKNVCPVNAIELTTKVSGNRSVTIDKSKCIKCGKCNKVCPIQNYNKKNFPVNVYAAWNSDKESQLKSSSGGIANAVMNYALSLENTECFATVWNYEIGCYTKKIETIEDIENAIGSKYLESKSEYCFDEIKQSLSFGKKIIFIGLPCQCAAVGLYFQKYRDKIILVDLVCHGGVPEVYFKQHIQNIEKKYKKSVDKIIFRTPVQGFCLSLFEKDSTQPFYKRKMHSAKDLYYLAFRENLIFKESCYRCQYANEKRFTDITIGDYSPGALWEYNGPRKINCMLVMTERGNQLVDNLLTSNLIKVIERPLSEPYSSKGNPQLRAPNKITKKHLDFIKYYEKTQDFDYSIKKVLKGYSYKVRIQNFGYFLFRCVRFIPRRLWWKINGKK